MGFPKIISQSILKCGITTLGRYGESGYRVIGFQHGEELLLAVVVVFEQKAEHAWFDREWLADLACISFPCMLLLRCCVDARPSLPPARALARRARANLLVLDYVWCVFVLCPSCLVWIGSLEVKLKFYPRVISPVDTVIEPPTSPD